jgi:threonine dehydrogenase-like Zn-dependent dehydrogenase
VAARHPAPNPKAQLITELGAAYLSTGQQTPPQIAAHIGNIDILLEATGSPTAGFEFLPLLGVNGIFIFTGVPGPTKDLELDAGALMRKLVLGNQVVLGTVNAPKQAFEDGLRDLSAFLQRWPKTLLSLITRRLPVDRLAEVLGEGDSAEIKTVLTF